MLTFTKVMKKGLIGCAIGFLSAGVFAQVYKCYTYGQAIGYSDRPCAKDTLPLRLDKSLVSVVELDYNQRRQLENTKIAWKREGAQQEKALIIQERQQKRAAETAAKVQQKQQANCERLSLQYEALRKKDSTQSQRKALVKLDEKLSLCQS